MTRATDCSVLARATAHLSRAEVEHRFAPPRRWRFDCAWPAARVALEVEGGVWSGGRHLRGSGFLGDMEKYNMAASMGWKVFRCTPPEVRDLSALRWILPELEGARG